jgi:hypothetical protein
MNKEAETPSDALIATRHWLPFSVVSYSFVPVRTTFPIA